MKNTLILCLILWCVGAVGFMASMSHQSSDSSAAWMLPLSFTPLMMIFLSYFYARKLGRSGAWGILAIFPPLLLPLLFLTEKTKGNLVIRGNMLEVKKGFSKSQLFPLDSLRYLFLIFPSNFNRFHVLSFSFSENIPSLHLDLLSGKHAPAVFQGLSDLLKNEKYSTLTRIKLYVVDYADQWIGITLEELKQNDPGFFEKIFDFREKRLHKLQSWLERNQEIVLKGGWGAKIIFDKRGVKKGRKEIVTWDVLGTIQFDKNSSMMYLLPRGISGGMFSFKKHAYGVRVSKKDRDRIYAECRFWQEIHALGTQGIQKLLDASQDVSPQEGFATTNFRMKPLES